MLTCVISTVSFSCIISTCFFSPLFQPLPTTALPPATAADSSYRQFQRCVTQHDSTDCGADAGEYFEQFVLDLANETPGSIDSLCGRFNQSCDTFFAHPITSDVATAAGAVPTCSWLLLVVIAMAGINQL